MKSKNIYLFHQSLLKVFLVHVLEFHFIFHPTKALITSNIGNNYSVYMTGDLRRRVSINRCHIYIITGKIHLRAPNVLHLFNWCWGQGASDIVLLIHGRGLGVIRAGETVLTPRNIHGTTHLTQVNVTCRIKHIYSLICFGEKNRKLIFYKHIYISMLSFYKWRRNQIINQLVLDCLIHLFYI